MLSISLYKSWSNFQLNINFKTPLGLIILYGPSGSGKTSICQAIAGLLSPERGHIKIGNRVFFDSLQNINIPTFRRNCGYVFQNYALFPHLNVRENIAFSLNKWTSKKREQRIKELSQLLDINNLLNLPIQKLSGGQSQRVAIARSLANYPEILLLDEPFNALDENLKKTLRKELKIIQKEYNLPIILVTHSRKDALELGDYMVKIKAGKVTEIGKPNLLLDNRSYNLPKNFLWG